MTGPKHASSKQVKSSSRGDQSRKLSELNIEMRAHEAAILEAKEGRGPFAEDPLAPCVTLVKWTIEHYPSGSPEIADAVEKPCRRFGKDKRYKNDSRLARLWVRYAELRNDKLAVFEYMQKYSIGETCAIVYEAWAMTLELSREYEKAEQVYRLGREKRAEPVERLAQRESEYYKRMAARRRRGAKRQPNVETQPYTNAFQSSRQKATEPVRERSGIVTSRTSSIKNEDISYGTRTRTALGPRLIDGSEDAIQSSTYNDTKISEQESRLGVRKMEEKAATSHEVSCSQGHSTSITGNVEVEAETKLTASEMVSKEQSVKPASLTKPNCTMSSKVDIESSRQTFSVYTEQESRGVCERKSSMNEKARKASKKIESVVCNTDSINTHEEIPRVTSKPSWSVHVDDGADNENHPPALAAKDIPNRPSRSFGHQIKEEERPPSPTINTKMAMQDVDDMFNTTLPMERMCKRGTASNYSVPHAPKPKKSVIEVFVDNCDPKTSESNPAPPPRSPKNCKIHVDEEFEDRETSVKGATRTAEDGGRSKITISGKRALHPITPIINTVTGNDANSNLADENKAMVSTCDHKRDVDVVTLSEPNNNNVGNVVVLNERVDNLPIESEGDDMQKLIDFFVKWTSSEPTFKLLQNEDPESFEDMFDLEPEVGTLATLGPYTICKGASNRSLVVLAEDLNNVFTVSHNVSNASEDSDEEEYPSVAVKVSDPNNIWEFYIYRELERRIAPKQLRSIPRATSFLEGRGRSYLVLNSVGITTLTEAVQISGDDGIPESAVMILAADLLKTLEFVHLNGFVHNDVTMDNVVVRNDGSEMDAKEVYDVNQNNGWEGRGVLLVDFNRAIDTLHWRVGGTDPAALVRYTQKEGDEFRHSNYRPPGTGGWGFNIDCFGVAVCVSKMLNVSLQDMSGRTLKHAAIWKEMFERLTSFDSYASPKMTVECMGAIRKGIEAALAQENNLLRYFTMFTNKLEEVNLKREEDHVIWK